jgi:hypothetical protein
MPEKEIRNDIFGVSFPILFYRNVNKAKNNRVINTLKNTQLYKNGIYLIPTEFCFTYNYKLSYNINKSLHKNPFW